MGEQSWGERQRVPLREAEATYRRVSADVRMLSTFRLRWSLRRAVRRAASGNTHDLVTVRAIRDEFRHRGMEAQREPHR